MQNNFIPPKVRTVLYYVAAIGTPIVAFLVEEKYIGAAYGTLWAGIIAAIGGIAASHVNNTPTDLN